MTELALLYTSFGSEAEAERVARTVLDERLAACVQLLPQCRSLYRWEGAVAEGAEIPVLFKTRPALARRLRDRIAALHSYALPVIETWPTTADARVARWIGEATGG